MRAVVQRVRDASVKVDGNIAGSIDKGLLIYLGVEDEDDEASSLKLARKLAAMRIFTDEQGKMNRSVLDVSSKALVISQFTLFADLRKGNRPSWSRAGEPEHAQQLFETFKKDLASLGVEVQSGVFRADMTVLSSNMGPVTVIADTHDF
ncbi:MAG: D-aminoacyl-tRNA deacylase [Sphaerochaetaceae bacterium]|nr:D-aminoacyl-tRNA deacylase [Sphaerochaetaceae bacterium]